MVKNLKVLYGYLTYKYLHYSYNISTKRKMNSLKLYTRNLLLIALYALINSADCSMRKETICHISNELKSYVIFNKGSYWIYQNQLGYRDTVKIQNIKFSIIDMVYSNPVERYEISIKSSLIYETKYIAQCSTGNEISCGNLNFLVTNNFSNILFFCGCDEGKEYQNLQFIEQIDSLYFYDEMFYNIKVFKSDSINNSSLSKLYYAKGVGLIKYEDFNSNVWQLMNYNISE